MVFGPEGYWDTSHALDARHLFLVPFGNVYQRFRSRTGTYLCFRSDSSPITLEEERWRQLFLYRDCGGIIEEVE
jgi:hypothetical protein